MPRQSNYRPGDSEARLLRFLCDSSVDMAHRTNLAVILESHRWHAADYTILFEAIRDLLPRNSQNILDHLPAALARRGFPDISCDALSVPSSLNVKAALALAEKLIRASQ